MDLVPFAMEERNKLKIKRRHFRDTENPFDIPGNRFIELYRLPIPLAIDLIDEITPHMPKTSRTDAIPSHLLILAAFNFYASGSYQRRVGQGFLQSMSQSKISYSIRTVSDVISKKLIRRYVQFPQTPQDMYNAKLRFLETTGIQSLIGLVDGTHILLSGLKKGIEAAHVNRKGDHSKNVQIICSADMEIINVFARYPGSSHDSFIWQNSMAHSFLEQNYESGDRSTFLFGDSGYPLQPWLITPITNPDSDVERSFNIKHSKVRSLVERTIGLWKIRFRCLLGENKLRYDPVTVGSIINTCAIIHNVLIKNKIGISTEEEHELNRVVNLDSGLNDTEDLYGNRRIFELGLRTRQRLISNWFRD